MVRLGRALKLDTVHAARFVLFAALVACGAEGGPSGSEPAPYEGPLPQTTNPVNPGEGDDEDDGNGPLAPADPDPASTDDDSSSEPSNGEIPISDIPVGSGQNDDDANGEGDDADDGNEPPLQPPQDPPPPDDQPGDDPQGPPVQPPVQPPPPQNTFVENTGSNCPLPQFPGADALPAINGLPDPFTRIDGTRIATRADWRCRRQEIKELAEQYIYGDKPGRPEVVQGSVTTQRITVDVRNGAASTSFSFTITPPTNGTAPFPALISVGGFSHNNLVRNEGVAIINFEPNVLGREQAPRNNKDGAFYDIYGSQSFTGALLAWSWGVSRMIDVIEASGSNVIRPDAIAVAGCSRNGKGAFTIGAFDERIALTIPFESGSGGVPIWRGIPGEGAQSLSSAYGETYWLGDAFGAFINNGQNRLPVDTHEIVAMVAPRGLLILDNPYIANLGPESAHVAALAGAEVYRALGAGANISYHSAVASGTHCEARPEHQEPLRQAIRKFLLRTGNAAGAITASGNATGNLAAFRNWTTPNLQ